MTEADASMKIGDMEMQWVGIQKAGEKPNSSPPRQPCLISMKGDLLIFSKPKIVGEDNTSTQQGERKEVGEREDVIVEVRAKDVILLDVTHLRLAGECKGAIECRVGGREVLIKVWSGQASDMEKLALALHQHNFKLHPSKYKIPTILHTPFLLQYYSTKLRKAMYYLESSYSTVVYLGLFLYVTNIVCWLPEFSIMGLFNTISSFWNASLGWLGFPQWMWWVITLLTSPLWLPPSLSLILTALGVWAARHYAGALLSLSLLHDVKSFLSLIKQFRFLLNAIRRTVNQTRKNKPQPSPSQSSSPSPSPTQPASQPPQPSVQQSPH